MSESLSGKVILITGAARRLGRVFALACARAGADVVVHHSNSEEEAEAVRTEVQALGRKVWVFQADFSDPDQAGSLIALINQSTPLHGLVNSAAIFAPLSVEETNLIDWQKHLQINLTAPFLLSQAFARQAQPGARIVNILDWRALRPGADHFPYTISKAALASMTHSLALALAPDILVNGLALGAILTPSDGNQNPEILKNIPFKRWARENEVEEALLFLLASPLYMTGEIIHVDGGRHLI
jgi:NAD(P)-dependent dehydrogenase (short-subunit alcohol dehydrogenase family)